MKTKAYRINYIQLPTTKERKKNKTKERKEIPVRKKNGMVTSLIYTVYIFSN